MRRMILAAALLSAGTASAAEFELAGMKSAVPTGWKEEAPSSSMRMAQFRLPKVEGDSTDAELALFVFPGGSGSVQQNLDRQLAKFVEDGRKDKADKVKVGAIDATYQDVSGTYKKKPFPMAEKFTPVEGYRQLYVVFEDKGGKQYYMTLLGPTKTVEKHKAAFEGWLKNFK